MGAEPVAAEVLAKALGDVVQGKAAGVGGDDGAGGADGLDLAQQSALELQVLHHGLDDPVAAGQQAKMVFEVSGDDQTGEAGLHKSGGLGLARPLQPCLGDAVAASAG